MTNYKEVCKKCGSESVYRLKWQNVNTGTVDINMDSGVYNEYCGNCDRCQENLIIDEMDYNLRLKEEL